MYGRIMATPLQKVVTLPKNDTIGERKKTHRKHLHAYYTDSLLITFKHLARVIFYYTIFIAEHQQPPREIENAAFTK